MVWCLSFVVKKKKTRTAREVMTPVSSDTIAGVGPSSGDQAVPPKRPTLGALSSLGLQLLVPHAVGEGSAELHVSLSADERLEIASGNPVTKETQVVRALGAEACDAEITISNAPILSGAPVSAVVAAGSFPVTEALVRESVTETGN